MCKKSKICTKCLNNKLLNEFNKGNGEFGLRYWCRSCCKNRSKQRTDTIRESDKYSVDTKVCSSCKEEKGTESFNKNKCSLDGLQGNCKQCRKLYRELNSLEISENSKKWRDVNKEYIAEKNKEYRQNNKESIKATKRKYEKNKRVVNPLFKLSTNLRRTMLLCFKNKNFGKNSSTLNIIGCTFEEFKAHIEKQFLNWMNWENYGNCEVNEYNCSWDLDHIIPISCAKTEEEVYLLNHWSNFQPLCSKINRWEKKNNLYPVYNLELNIEK